MRFVKVKVFLFFGCIIMDMRDYIKLVLWRNFNVIVMYVGINSFWLSVLVYNCVEEIVNLVIMISNEFLVDFVIFGIILRFDDEVFVVKVLGVNKIFKIFGN